MAPCHGSPLSSTHSLSSSPSSSDSLCQPLVLALGKTSWTVGKRIEDLTSEEINMDALHRNISDIALSVHRSLFLLQPSWCSFEVIIMLYCRNEN